jgi:hypothetical protein
VSRDCVELAYSGETAPADRTGTLTRLRDALTRSPDDPYVEDFHGRFEATVVTEPETLIPHRIRLSERLRLRLRFGDGRVEELDERSDDDYRFTSQRAPAAGTSASSGPSGTVRPGT